MHSEQQPWSEANFFIYCPQLSGTANTAPLPASDPVGGELQNGAEQEFPRLYSQALYSPASIIMIPDRAQIQNWRAVCEATRAT